MYVSEQKVKTVAEAATVADDYWLTHRDIDPSAHVMSDRVNGPAGFFSGRSGGGFVPGLRVDHGVRKFDNVCHFCHRRGHQIKNRAPRQGCG